jgi:hypothetical protein
MPHEAGYNFLCSCIGKIKRQPLTVCCSSGLANARFGFALYWWFFWAALPFPASDVLGFAGVFPFVARFCLLDVGLTPA